MKKESKYLIVKWDDIFKHLTQGQLDMLDLILSKIRYGKLKEKAKERKYYGIVISNVGNIFSISKNIFVNYFEKVEE